MSSSKTCLHYIQVDNGEITSTVTLLVNYGSARVYYCHILSVGKYLLHYSILLAGIYCLYLFGFSLLISLCIFVSSWYCTVQATLMDPLNRVF